MIAYAVVVALHTDATSKKKFDPNKKKFWIKYQREIFYSICISLPASSHTTTTKNERMWYTLKTFFFSFRSQFTIKYVIHCSCCSVVCAGCSIKTLNFRFFLLYFVQIYCIFCSLKSVISVTMSLITSFLRVKMNNEKREGI